MMNIYMKLIGYLKKIEPKTKKENNKLYSINI